MTSNASKSCLCQKALRLISRRACDGLTVKDILRELGVSRLALEREFAAQVGKMPGQMLKEARLTRAKELLTTTQLPVKQIAQAVGYVSASNFGAFFRSQIGQSPQEYRSARRYGTGAADTSATPSEARRALPGRGMLGSAIHRAAGDHSEQPIGDVTPGWPYWDQKTGIDAKSPAISLATRQFGYQTTSNAVFTAALRGNPGANDA